MGRCKDCGADCVVCAVMDKVNRASVEVLPAAVRPAIAKVDIGEDDTPAVESDAMVRASVSAVVNARRCEKCKREYPLFQEYAFVAPSGIRSACSKVCGDLLLAEERKGAGL